jgi:hypothetical protein
MTDVSMICLIGPGYTGAAIAETAIGIEYAVPDVRAEFQIALYWHAKL